jgi:hypothetical protein
MKFPPLPNLLTALSHKIAKSRKQAVKDRKKLELPNKNSSNQFQAKEQNVLLRKIGNALHSGGLWASRVVTIREKNLLHYKAEERSVWCW